MMNWRAIESSYARARTISGCRSGFSAQSNFAAVLEILSAVAVAAAGLKN